MAIVFGYNSVSMLEALGRTTTTVAGMILVSTMTTATVSVQAVDATPRMRLDVLLTVSSQLPGLSRRTLLGEAERIWARERVDVEWPAAAGGAERPDSPLRVLVIVRPKNAAESRRWPVAELVRYAEDRALAIASIDAARRVVDKATRFSTLEFPGMEEHRLGLVLGRAVAHEIGHYLLRTDTHASQGLMRAHIDVKEFADLNSHAFNLDDAAQAHLAALAARGSLSGNSAVQPFSYAAAR